MTGGLVWSACSSEENLTELEQGNGMNFTLQINSGELQSRATITESENSIQTLDIYLYPNDGESKNALFHYSHVLNTIVTDGSETVTVNIPGKIVNSLFPNNATTCTAYVIANKGTVTLPEDYTSMSSLKGTILNEADFTKQQDLFVMDGSNTVSYNTTDRTISGTVDLFRAASKISLIVTGVQDVVEDDFGNIWQSDPANYVMKVGFYNGVKKATIDVNAVPYEIEDEDYFNIASNPGRVLSSFNVTNDDSSTSTHYTHELPFYSYSSEWTSGDPTAPYLIVVVPWQKLDQNGNPDGDFTPCYYQIPINETNKKLERNHYYEIKLNIGILGSFTPDEPLPIENATYVVLNWSEAPTNATLKEYRYLVVDKNFVEMDNINTIDIGMATSHDISYRILSITKPDYSEETISTTTIYSYNENTETSIGSTTGFNFGPNVANNQANLLTYSHTLDNNNTSTTYDYVPYTVRVKVWHTDKPEYYEIIEYKQYPAMYIEAVTNNNHSTVFVYNNSGQQGSWDDLVDLSSGGNHNPNMYIINVSAFIGNTNYIIGDSRSTDFVTGESLGIGRSINNKTLQYYYPTRTDNINIIAPKFRVASSHGKCASGISSLENAKKRCAAYQEDGYPAGRWRVPTVAEFGYIAYISGKGYIPHLYSLNKYYWTASGIYQYKEGEVQEGSSDNVYVRCVYDEWYWTDKCDKNTFTWGDKEITW